jgi:hypothetical protein
MLIFSEVVEPIFTDHKLNFLNVESYSEIFFDVYSVYINGLSYVAEKISEYEGHPIINVPIVIDNTKCFAPFVLNKGKLEVIFNKNNVGEVEGGVLPDPIKEDTTY